MTNNKCCLFIYFRNKYLKGMGWVTSVSTFMLAFTAAFIYFEQFPQTYLQLIHMAVCYCWCNDYNVFNANSYCNSEFFNQRKKKVLRTHAACGSRWSSDVSGHTFSPIFCFPRCYITLINTKLHEFSSFLVMGNWVKRRQLAVQRSNKCCSKAKSLT